MDWPNSKKFDAPNFSLQPLQRVNDFCKLFRFKNSMETYLQSSIFNVQKSKTIGVRLLPTKFIASWCRPLVRENIFLMKHLQVTISQKSPKFFHSSAQGFCRLRLLSRLTNWSNFRHYWEWICWNWDDYLAFENIHMAQLMPLCKQVWIFPLNMWLQK